MRGLASLIVVAWLAIGVLAAWQRGYFDTSEQNCASIGTTLVTVVAGPLNYMGANPQIDCEELPEPSE
ncbi:hypothetical protein NI17_000675 [Thermobifida halotolerans]|uniref:Uncharacterized protein n=1 Tax=Thermobifida halotolerans TaxID=483545 RepID=A0A399G276_9ACTN|nr:hypothetical protein [Thermobifida halotolerans]UOE19817.1 hypothetical protein NI17_000675 [Thermobifida halotolerans]